ncbi:MAG UNVERIFIED_CONTAM: ankyrin repeat domain-containing protein [Anaerolineae bacterium]|jgi:serine/threonine-protein phosphatase 6 regulatory ankyrin repeat subunit B
MSISKTLPGRTALLWASENGHEEVVKALLAHNKVDVNLQDSVGRTALCWASVNGHVEVVKALLNNDKVNVSLHDRFSRTALLRASENGHLEVVMALLTSDKVNVNLKDRFSRTAMLMASLNGHEDVVKALLTSNKVNVNLQDLAGRTALLWASGRGHVEVVKALLAHDMVDVNLQDLCSQNSTLVGECEWTCGSCQGVADQRQDECQSSRLCWQKTALIRLQVVLGVSKWSRLCSPHNSVDVNLQDSAGRTALLWASVNCHEDVVKALLTSNKVNVNLQDSAGRTALLVGKWKRACRSGQGIARPRHGGCQSPRLCSQEQHTVVGE